VKKKNIIRKILVLSAWLLVISGMTTLLVAANRKQKDHVCRKVWVGIKAAGENFYIEKEDVLALIEKSARGSLLGKPIVSIDLGGLEKSLENNSWIRNAELYFDSKDDLHVSVEEREPIARVFTTAGNSFYIDSSGHKMPLLEKISARVPVVTGFTNAKKMNTEDSAVLNGIKQVAAFIYGNEFWNAQIGQIDITPDRKFELIPVVGDHIIKLGDAEKTEEKLNRLYVFYKQVMSKVGFNKYAALDIQYEGQVVAVRKGPVSEVDSIQLQKNIEGLMNKASLQNVEAEMLPEQNIGPLKNVDSAATKTAAQINSVSTKTDPDPTNPNQNPAKATGTNPARETQSKPIERTGALKTSPKPKAVMKKRG
jgi:cell division protein FtsQ